MSQRYCRHCGAELGEGDRYCSDCGKETDVGETYPTQYGTESEYDTGDDWGDTDDAWGEANTHDHDSGAGTYDPASGRDVTYREGESDTTLAAITHVLALFTWLIGPLIVYLVTDDPFVKENAANATNWQIMFSIYLIVSFVLVFVLVGILFLIILPLLDLAFIIIAAIKAGEGEAWTYPLTPSIL